MARPRGTKPKPVNPQHSEYGYCIRVHARGGRIQSLRRAGDGEIIVKRTQNLAAAEARRQGLFTSQYLGRGIGENGSDVVRVAVVMQDPEDGLR